jgi:glycosyltransferase involved in cell wall biosynthesis
MAIESFDLSGYDLIISTSSCVAKGIIPPPGAVHVSYIHSPMRYVWDQEHRYFPKKVSFSKPVEILRRLFLNYLRLWDVTSSARVDLFIANSAFVARRCQLYYGLRKKPEVVHPPIEVERFLKPWVLPAVEKQNTVLLFGAWVPYKRMLWALEILLQRGGITILAAGQGEEFTMAQKKFSHHGQVKFYPDPTDQEVVQLYAHSQCLLFPAIEDFGMIPVEAMAAGVWVVAPSTGGTAETVQAGVTGFLFSEGSPQELKHAVEQALHTSVTKDILRGMQTHVQKFNQENFRTKMQSLIEDQIKIAREDQIQIARTG